MAQSLWSLILPRRRFAAGAWAILVVGPVLGCGKNATSVGNVAPTANAVMITGVAEVGQGLTGNYTYEDVDGDPEGVSTFGWLRSGSPIGGATEQSYTLVGADEGAEIAFEVTPVASSGESPGTAVRSEVIGPVMPANVVPTASEVVITGVAEVGQELTGGYTYEDVDGDPEGVSTFGWLRSGSPIGGATGQSYTLVGADEGAEIAFEVTPVASSGESPGAAARSEVIGPVLPANVAPTASAVMITGVAEVGQELTGGYTYEDVDGDPEGVSTFQWLRGGSPIGAATGQSYTLVGADEGAEIAFEVTPVASSGESPGAAARSEAIGPVLPAPSEPFVVLVGAGDIANCNYAGAEETSRLLDTIPGTVVALGDNAYPDGRTEDYADCYEPTWGRHRLRTRPSPGNHDYRTADAQGYFDYFGDAAGNPATGYYSYDLGEWHVISLDSEIDVSAGSPQEQWLRADLAAHPSTCTVAYWHKPRFSSGDKHGSNARTQPLWEALYEYGADLILNGHEHVYERFAPQTPQGTLDNEGGIRQFTVGTGGTRLYGFSTPLSNSEARYDQSWGVLKLSLYADRYVWQFVPVAGATYTDIGEASCHE